MFVVVVGYWWWCSGYSNAFDSLFNGGSCDRCRSTIVVVMVVEGVVVLVVKGY